MRHINLSTVRFEYGTIDEAKAKGFDVENNNGMSSIIPNKEFSDTYFVTPEAAEKGTDKGVYLLIKTSEFIKDAAIMSDFEIRQDPEKALKSISSFMNAMAEAIPQVIKSVKEQFAQVMEANKSAEPQAEAEENNAEPADDAEPQAEKKSEDSDFKAVDEE